MYYLMSMHACWLLLDIYFILGNTYTYIGLKYIRVSFNELLNFFGVNILSSTNYQVLDPTNYLTISILQKNESVPG